MCCLGPDGGYHRGMERVFGLFTLKLGSKPLGIWLSWLGLAYAAMAFANRFFSQAGGGVPGGRPVAEEFVAGAVVAAAIGALFRRRLIARMFCGMAMLMLLLHCISVRDPFGIVLSPLAVLGIVANRRWFDEKLPLAGW